MFIKLGVAEYHPIEGDLTLFYCEKKGGNL